MNDEPTTYPVGAGDDDDLKNSIVDGIKTLEITFRIRPFLFKKNDQSSIPFSSYFQNPSQKREKKKANTYRTNLSQRTDISLCLPCVRSILLYITHRIERIRIYVTTTELACCGLVCARNGRHFTEGRRDEAGASERASE